MTSYVLTPGQHDILAGSYSREFIDRNVIAVAVRAPEQIDDARLAQAAVQTSQSHPALRAEVVVGSTSSVGRQEICGAADCAAPPPLLVESGGGDLQDELTDLVRGIADRLDITTGTVWGVVRHRGRDGDHLLFVINHIAADMVAVARFVRTFLHAYLAGPGCSPVRDTYLEHLTDLARARDAPPTEDVRWWWDRPWGGLPDLVVGPSSAEPERHEPVQRVDLVPDHGTQGTRLTETTLLDTVDRSLRDVAGLAVTRIDVATHGRADRVTRTAAGWISHALPCIGRTESDLRATYERAAAWPVAFHAVRRRADLSTADHLRAHAFVNFFGTVDPRRWTVGGFRMSSVQPRSTVPRRASLTPVRLVVRRDREGWGLARTLGGTSSAGPMSVAVADQVLDRLTRTRP